MPQSEAYARIKRDVMTIARKIPPGRVTTFAAIGAFLDVVPRQVAYLLALRNDEDRESVPWYRVVSDDGALGRTPKSDAHGRSQAELLTADGILVDRGQVSDFEKRVWQPTTRNTGVKPVRRADAMAAQRASSRPAPRRRS
jgi:methylated-DNA-protein-cysteine methyltransferase related protein